MPAADQFRIWADETEADAVRLVAFERWLAIRLGEALIWPTEREAQQRQIGQCRAAVMEAVADLGKHGFHFRPRELAGYVDDQLDRIAHYQRAGHVRDLYGYIRGVWTHWVSRNAEELEAEAKHQRVHHGNMPSGKPPSMGAIVLRDLEAKAQEIRDKRLFRKQLSAARHGDCKGSAGPLLPGL